ncbi:MAG: Uncharacterised protein [Prochlorococcus marinus str. MIT 9215]|nr:MAG: Uncharacterised protein [Prochlorococcus marinus str. MIT 9215]
MAVSFTAFIITAFNIKVEQLQWLVGLGELQWLAITA